MSEALGAGRIPTYYEEKSEGGVARIREDQRERKATGGEDGVLVAGVTSIYMTLKKNEDYMPLSFPPNRSARPKQGGATLVQVISQDRIQFRRGTDI